MKTFLDDNLRNDSLDQGGQRGLLRRRRRQVPGVPRPGLRRTSRPRRARAAPTPSSRASPQTAGITGAALDTWQQCYDAGKYVDYVNSVETKSFEDGVNAAPRRVRLDGTDLDLGQVGTPELLTKAIEDATK